MEGDTESGRFDHFDIVVPVAGREHAGRLHAFFIAQPQQGIQFRGAPEDRFQNVARQLVVRERRGAGRVSGPGPGCERRFGLKPVLSDMV